MYRYPRTTYYRTLFYNYPLLGQSYSNVTRPTRTPQYYAPSAVYTPPQQYHVNSAPILKQCGADGCANKVHYDAELGPFDYCSPGCRDRHLLPLERAQLKRDIEENSRKIATFVQQYVPPSSGAVSTAATNEADNKKGEIHLYICVWRKMLMSCIIHRTNGNYKEETKRRAWYHNSRHPC